MLKRFALILATVVAGFLGAVAVTSPAQAAPVDCPTAQICFWIHTDYAGSYVNYAPDVLGFNTCVNFPAAFNNQIFDGRRQRSVQSPSSHRALHSLPHSTAHRSDSTMIQVCPGPRR